MLVKDLIEKLKEFDENAVVEVYRGYDPEYGECYDYPENFILEDTGWDYISNSTTKTLYIS
tara:strand:- start:19563 stop:19745 length:183 start_codon:yes stop_codon:yes gene_type:complete